MTAPAADGTTELGAAEARETAGGGLWEWLFGPSGGGSFGGSGQTAGGGGGSGY